jgi:MFS transporter, DHA3 family, macrolide efflux protein
MNPELRQSTPSQSSSSQPNPNESSSNESISNTTDLHNSNLEHPEISGNWQPRFWTIWLGQALSLIGSALTQFVLVWWITQTTNSANALAIAGIAGLLPQAVLAPIGGAVADRYSRRLIMIVADTITALCMIVLVILFASKSIQLWHVYTLMALRSSMQAFQTPASSASAAMLVPKDWLPRVAGMNQTLMGVMTIAAAPLGALALAWMPLERALLIDVATALLGIVPLFFYAIPQIRNANPNASLLADITEGLRFVRGNSGLVKLYGMLALVILTIFPTFSLLPLLIKDHFKGGINEVALLEGLSGIGMIVGGVFISVWPPRNKVLMFLISFVVSCGTVALTALAPSNMLWLAVAWWVLSGISFSTGQAPMTAILQIVVPNQMQGRTTALMNMIMGFAGPIGLVITGPLGESFGVRSVFIWGGALSALICALALFSKDLMGIERSSEKRSIETGT